ncbi:hypothetical protein HF086_006474 [Spodoptera exigua]|uniref:Uncharacterized protein n=1 Tax=Spodoptera exigua TaxID=7107 RepID=A0A922MKS8_SPOEX|nr:hypothetical protein HF086_006474 [Spodoptera exigua]
MRVEDRGDVGVVDSSEVTTSVSESNKKYFKTATVNGSSVTAFIDFGSECSMIRLSVFRKIGSCYNVNKLPVLRGFGNSSVQCVGKQIVQIVIDNVEANLELPIVPDDVMHVPLLVGQTFTEQPHVIIRRTSDSLERTMGGIVPTYQQK